MTKKSIQQENELEILLRKLPKIEDNRSVNRIFTSLEFAERRKKRFHWTPLLASAVAIFIVSIIASSFIFGNNSNDENFSMSQDSEIARNEMEIADKDSTDQNQSGAQSVKEIHNENKLMYSLYNTDLMDNNYFTLAIPTKSNRYYVPLTFLIEKGSIEDSIVALLEEAKNIDEASLGLSEFFPLGAELFYKSESKTVMIDLSESTYHNVSDKILLNVFQETFKYQQIEQLRYALEGEIGVEFPYIGYLENEMVNKYTQKATMIYQFDESSPRFFVSSFNSSSTIEEAFEIMKTTDNPEDPTVFPTIPSDWVYEIIEEDSLLHIKFDEETELNDSITHQTALEAILLTARDFGYEKVLFGYNGLSKIGTIELNKELEVPIAPNVMNK